MILKTSNSGLFILAFCLSLLLHSCKPRVELDKLKLDANCLYYNSDDSKKTPFSGVAYATFKNSIREDPNTISHTTNFKNGVPDGKYVDYASKGEVFQSGEFVPVFEVAELQKHFSSIKRLSICKTHFNSLESEILVIIISSQPNIDSTDLNSRQEIVKDFIRKNKYLSEKEFKVIYKIEVVQGEF